MDDNLHLQDLPCYGKPKSKETASSIHAPVTACRSSGEDVIIGRNDGRFAQGYAGEGETPLEILTRVAAIAGLNEKPTSYCIGRGPRNSVDSECTYSSLYIVRLTAA
jgi:hypothetical protein